MKKQPMTIDPLTFRRDLEHTQNLAEAIARFFHLNLEGRLCIFDQEVMEGEVALAYNALGLESRQQTYRNVAQDFISRTNYTDSLNGFNRILEVGSGPGLLALALAEQTNAIIFGLDLSADMIALANQNKERRRDGAMTNRVRFVKRNVYDLTNHSQNEQSLHYVVCRNTLHRFRDPKEALRQMYAVLKHGGKLYIRDLRRDADWKTVVERIGEARWKTPVLVRDYLGAMAGMLTVEELETILRELNINKFTLTDGRYKPDIIEDHTSLREYAQATEYVCIIEK